MKIIVHIGMPRAGSNAIQSCLAESREYLLTKGILYPHSSFVPTDRHHPLAIPAYNGSNIPICFVKNSLDEQQVIFNEFKASLIRQISRTLPQCVLLSTETLFNRYSPDYKDKLLPFLQSISEDIEIVGVIRDPVSFYQSLIHQILRRTHIVPKFKYNFKFSLQQYLEKYEHVRVWRYNKDSIGFICSILEDYNVQRERLSVPIVQNISASAEGTVLLQEYRRNFHKQNHWKKTRDTDTFLSVLNRVESKRRTNKIVLRDPVRKFIENSTIDIENWLNSNFADYCLSGKADLNESQAVTQASIDIDENTNVADLVNVNEDAVNDLKQDLLASKWAQNNKLYLNWVRQL